MAFDLTACINGDKRAWDALVERYARVIFAAVSRTVCRRADGSEIEDIAQDVFVRLVRDDYRQLRSYDASRASFTTWLTVISRSVAIDHLRKRRPVEVPLEAAPPPSVDDPPAPPEAPPIPAGLLSGRQKLVLTMLFEKQMTVSEAADALGVDPQTIRSTKHKALTKLRSHFGDRR